MQSAKYRENESRATLEETVNAEDVRERPSDDDIARRAYERYEVRGRADGYALDDWLDAEQELRDAERRP
jgi:Protein of unknown function (DUF2934)